jgi:hypothetical protein
MGALTNIIGNIVDRFGPEVVGLYKKNHGS